MTAAASDEAYTQARIRLVGWLRRQRVANDRVLQAIGRVPRHLFVPEPYRDAAYEDRALPLGRAQTISQPTVVAMMTNALRLCGDERVLEVGAGSGYQAAVLAELAKEVFTLERLTDLAAEAAKRLHDLGYTTVTVVVGDGSGGWPDAAPYDAILVTAATPKVFPAWFEQLREGGCLVAPVGSRASQQLMRYTKFGDRPRAEDLGPCVFVPLIAEGAFPPTTPPHPLGDSVRPPNAPHT